MISLTEAYGTYARSSLFADLIEIDLLLNGGEFLRSKIADILYDNRESFNAENKLYESMAEEDDESGSDVQKSKTVREQMTERATDVFSLLHERQRVLGGRYPFAVSRDGIESRCGINRHCGYSTLLVVSVCHAFDLDAVRRVTDYFPELVSRAVSKHAHSVNFGAFRRHASDFETALSACRDVLGFGGLRSGTIVHSAANDSGADIVAQVSWRDTLRPGRWMWVGQATCGVSDSWVRKANEPKPVRWKSLLGDDAEPVVFLAVPHHVEPLHLKEILESKVYVLDRLRLAPSLSESDYFDAKVYFDAVAKAGVELR